MQETDEFGNHHRCIQGADYRRSSQSSTKHIVGVQNTTSALHHDRNHARDNRPACTLPRDFCSGAVAERSWPPVFDRSLLVCISNNSQDVPLFVVLSNEALRLVPRGGRIIVARQNPRMRPSLCYCRTRGQFEIVNLDARRVLNVSGLKSPRCGCTPYGSILTKSKLTWQISAFSGHVMLRLSC